MFAGSDRGFFRTISIPLPTHRLASSALRALQVDAELSSFVRRTFALDFPPFHERRNLSEEATLNGIATSAAERSDVMAEQDVHLSEEDRTVLRTEYKATTNRMLRVAVNGFMESLGVVLGVMEELDVDVLAQSLKSTRP